MMKRACELMKETTLSVADIDEQTGFQTPGYFIKVLKNHFGETPGHYASRVRQQQMAFRMYKTALSESPRRSEIVLQTRMRGNDGNSRNFFLFYMLVGKTENILTELKGNNTNN